MNPRLLKSFPEEHTIKTSCGNVYKNTSSILWLIVGLILFGNSLTSLIYDVWFVHREDGQWLFYVCIYVMIVSVSTFILSVFTEPGILPPLLDLRQVSGSRGNILSLIEKPAQNETRDCSPHPSSCTTCHAPRFPGTSHCSECRVCVRLMDHHCPWLSNCIGQRNYRHFVIFLLAYTILAFNSCINAAWHLIKVGMDGFREAINVAPLSAILFLVNLVFFLSIGGLSCYHVYLISVNLTTRDCLKISPTTSHTTASRETRFDNRFGWAAWTRFCCLSKPTSCVMVAYQMSTR
jgi:palmitoyltransferase ZDHHC9/14/18